MGVDDVYFMRCAEYYISFQAILDKELTLVCDTGSKYVRDEWIRALKDVIRSWKNMDRRASVKVTSSAVCIVFDSTPT